MCKQHYVAQRTPEILCLKRKHQLIDARRLCEAMSASIIPLHVLTGYDHTSGFYDASKVIADRLQKSKEAQDVAVSSVWHTAPSHTRIHLRLGAVCHLLCIW